MASDRPPGGAEGLGLERAGSEEVYFTYDGAPLLSFGGLSDFTFYANRETYDYLRWADWATDHGMNHLRAYLPTSFRYVEQFAEENDGTVDAADFPYERAGPGTFDLDRLNDAYWDRFHEQCAALAERGIIVHLLLVNGWHVSNHIASPDAINWGGHFFNPENNVNPATDHLDGDRHGFYFSVADGHDGLAELQKRFLRRAVAETASLGNVYYDLVHELHPTVWLPDHGGSWEGVSAWLEEMARAVRSAWDDHAASGACLLGQDTSNMTPDQEEWVLSRPYFDLAIYGRIHSVERAREWRERYGKPYVPQESIDDSGDKYSYREPNQRVHARKYFWKFTMAKCQQMDLYVKERTEGMSPNVGVTQPPGLPHDYDPRGWNAFEDDAPVLRDFFESLEDYPNLWFDGTVAEGPGSHQYVLSSSREAVAYCSSATAEEGVDFEPATLALDDLALDSGTYAARIVDPASGPVDSTPVAVEGGTVSIALPAFADDVAVHLVGEE